MEVVKYVVFFALVGLVIWLTIDTIIYAVKKIKAKKAKAKAKEVEQKDVNKE